MIIKKTLLAITLALSSMAASAAWEKAAANDTQALYIDRSSIRKSGNMAKMWAMTDLNKPLIIANESALSTKRQDEYDCKRERLRTVFFAFYSDHMGGGETLISNPKALDWAPVAPGTMSQSLWEAACKG